MRVGGLCQRKGAIDAHVEYAAFDPAEHLVGPSNGVARFEVTEELSRHHHHLVCSGCGRLDDVDLPDRVEATLHSVTAQVGEALGYEVDEHRLELIGRCASCR